MDSHLECISLQEWEENEEMVGGNSVRRHGLLMEGGRWEASCESADGLDHILCPTPLIESSLTSASGKIKPEYITYYKGQCSIESRRLEIICVESRKRVISTRYKHDIQTIHDFMIKERITATVAPKRKDIVRRMSCALALAACFCSFHSIVSPAAKRSS